MAGPKKVYFNGINALTGQYGIPPMDYAQLASIVRGEPQEQSFTNWSRKKNQQLNTPSFGLPFGVDPANITKAGWAIVFHQDEDEAVKQALEPLIEHRRKQINNDKVCKILEYRPDDGATDVSRLAGWLVRYGVTSSNVVPSKVPYYVLLIGSAEKIPFLFGYLLDAEYAVGRLHFNTVEGYRTYTSNLIEYETRSSLDNTKEVIFFAPRHNFDKATQLSADHLVDPLADNKVPDDLPNISDFGYAVRKYRKGDATKENLSELLTRKQPAPILFTASHGLEFPAATSEPGRQRQLQEQGALVCQDWPALGTIQPEHYFSASDLLNIDTQLQGMITFHFACFGGGTPSRNRFLQFEQAFGGAAVPTLAEQAFFAALPKALLSHPQGGALATIAHVERAWGCSFVHPQAGVQLLPFANAIGRILAGQCVGHAMDDFNRKYINLSAMLTSKLEDLLNEPVSDEELAQDWLERNDAESYVVIGDPAVRLRTDLLQQPT